MAMSEFEKRCRAADLLMEEASIALAQGELTRAADVLRARLTEGISGDDLEVRLYALARLEAAVQRSALLLTELGPDCRVCDAGLVLDRDEHQALRRPPASGRQQ